MKYSIFVPIGEIHTLIQIQDLDTAGTNILVYGQKIQIMKMKVGFSPMGMKMEYFTEMISVLKINKSAVLPNSRTGGSQGPWILVEMITIVKNT